MTGRYGRQSCVVEKGLWQSLIIIRCRRTLNKPVSFSDGYREEVIVALSSRLPSRFNSILVDSSCRRSRVPIGDDIKQNAYIPRARMSQESRCSQNTIQATNVITVTKAYF